MSRAMYVALIGSNKDIFKKWKVFGSYLYYFPFPPFCLNEDGSLDMQDHSSDVPGFCKIMFRADGFSDVQLEGKKNRQQNKQTNKLTKKKTFSLSIPSPRYDSIFN